ncbi:MAG TPA: TldD/PmbA family protein [Prolixibacteraceae bacterium]|nr:TldD/PmbA family protein [Prolixibacteraceae bacterium]
MNTNEKYDLAAIVIEHAIKQGAQQVSVTINDNRTNNIEIRDQKIDSLKESIQSNLSVSLYVDKRYSAHTTNRMKKDELLRFVDEAVIATRYLSEDEFRSLPEPDLYYKGAVTDLDIFDEKLDSVDPKTKIDLANKALNEAYKKDERIISVSAYYSDNISDRVMVASNGFKGNTRNSRVSLSASVSLKTDSGRPSDYWDENALFINKLKTDGIGTQALEKAIKKIGPKKIASGNYRVIIENRVAGNLVWPVFQALQGASLYKKQSFLIGKENQPVASSLLTVIDDPLMPSGFGSRLFDHEGLAAVKRPVIEKGVLRNYFIDNYYGRKLRMKPTSGSGSNVVYQTGTKSREEMIKSLTKGILITGFIGGNCNGSTGDFSYGIEGFLIQDGLIIHPVNEMNISGNMKEFWFNLIETGNDPWQGGSNMIPSLMFDQVALSGI